MGEASRQSDEQPRRWLRIAHQHTHATPHHGTGAGRAVAPARGRRRTRRNARAGPQLGATTGLRRGELSGLRRTDEATADLLRQHLAEMDARAALCGTSVPPDGFAFTLDPTCNTPMRPELLTRRMRQLRKELGLTDGSFDATMLALRKLTTSELMDAGLNPAALSGRQGHTVQVMLHHYSTRRESADKAAAEHAAALSSLPGAQFYSEVASI